ncbi:hypothetical protein FYJ51_11565 [Erysipelotrichaceae bacterium Oil+RF-744-GAM-WT-6]|uniref:Uncharacterized protein n=1 Tax=Stecheria intestinalis TaxID=2606630 RepID=A0A7X2NU07_9FIRM|nr:hypothetical protein [Stecheria intestinalis]MSS59530.1 hypothetical protein [Stecheria intestinalis]
MSLLDIPPGTDVNELKKRMNILQKKARDRAKPDRCILCGQKHTSFCNSHSVPQMVLNKIGKNGQIVQSNAIFGLEILKDTDGINRSGTFHIICRECDKNYLA